MATTKHEVLHPANWKAPKGYANGIAATGRMVFLGGLIGWNANRKFESDDFIEQVKQTLGNILEVLSEAGGKPQDIVRMTWFITDKQEYLSRQKELGVVYRAILGKHFPAMSMVQVAALIEDRAKVEIEATAVIPENSGSD